MCVRRARNAVALAGVLLSATSQAAIIRVKANAPGANNGTNWFNAFQSPAAALAAANPGDEIWIAAGTYRLTAQPFQLKSNVAVYGGFSGIETVRDARNWMGNVVVFSGDVQGNDGNNFLNRADNLSPVVIGDNLGPATRLDGITISGGFGPTNGAGLRIVANANLTVANCTFRDNKTTIGFGQNGGGGAYCGSGNPVFLNCLFERNATALEDGAGLYIAQGTALALIKDCRFLENSAGEPSAFSSDVGAGAGCYVRASANIETCLFRGNMAFGGGGAAGTGVGLSATAGALVISGCTFEENVANVTGSGSGSGVGAYISSSSPVSVTNCIFRNNRTTADGSGGGLFMNCSGMTELTNCSFTGNATAYRGGGASLQGGTISLTNCSFANNGNATTDAGGGLYCLGNTGAFWRCIFTGNRADQGGAIHSFSGTPKFESCRIVGNQAVEGGGIFLSAGTVRVANTVIARNSATTGGGIRPSFAGGSSLTVINSTLAANTGAGSAINSTGFNVSVLNSILWSPSPLVVAGGTSSVAYSDVFGGVGGPGNISADPQFRDAASDDYHLRLASPCVNAGNTDPNLPTGDFESDPRTLGAWPDMGCDELYVLRSGPNEVAVLEGDLFGGGIGELLVSDDQYFGAYGDSNTLRCVVGAWIPCPFESAEELAIDFEHSVGREGLSFSVRLFNTVSATFQPVFGGTASTTDHHMSAVLAGAANWIGPDGRVQVRVSWQPVNDEDPSQDGWLHSVDELTVQFVK